MPRWQRVTIQVGPVDEEPFETVAEGTTSKREAQRWLRVKERSHREAGWDVRREGDEVIAERLYDSGLRKHRRMFIREV